MVLNITLVRGLVKYKGKYLFLQRAKDIIPENIGKWECPGGKVSKSENPRKAITREIKEETDLNCKILKELPVLQIKTKKYDSKCYVYLVKVMSNKVKLSSDHFSYKWIKSKDVKDLHLVLFASLLLEYFNNLKFYLS